MLNKHRVLVAIPSYRCEKQITRVLEQFKPNLLARIEKVIVIDNVSPDRTAQVAQQAIQRLHLEDKFEVIVNDHNYGLGGSQKVAFTAAEKWGMDYVAIIHGDDQAKTEELESLLDEAERHPYAGAILGARFMRQSKLQNYSKLRTIGNVTLNALYTLLSFRMTKDLGSGLNLFKVESLKDQRFLYFSNAFTFNMDLLLDYYRKRVPVKFVPITWRETDQTSNVKVFRIGWITLTTLLRWRLGLPKRNEFIDD